MPNFPNIYKNQFNSFIIKWYRGQWSLKLIFERDSGIGVDIFNIHV